MGVGGAQDKSRLFIDTPDRSAYTFFMAIPRIIHQTWKSESLPPSFHFFRETWRRHHSDWEYRFYDDDACRRVVETWFPELLPLYDCCPHPIQRADIFRYLVVAREGGVYADMDMECLRNVDPLLEGRRAVFGVEDRLSHRQTRRMNLRYAERIANFVFAAEADHPVFQMIIGTLKELPGKWNLREEILETTGPGFLTNIVQDNRDRLGLTVIPRICWAPPNWGYPDCFPFNLHMYARHHFAGTWKKNLPLGEEERGFRSVIRAWDPREIAYRLPPFPLWLSDLLFWKRKDVRP